MSMAEASFHDSLTNSISPVRNVKIPIYAPCQGRLFPCMGCWPMLAGKAHTGPQKGGQRGICLPGQYPETVPGSVSARRRHRGQGGCSPCKRAECTSVLCLRQFAARRRIVLRPRWGRLQTEKQPHPGRMGPNRLGSACHYLGVHGDTCVLLKIKAGGYTEPPAFA